MTRTRSSRVTCCPTVTASSTLPSYLSTRALPAFYTVVTGDGVKAELTATSHAGLHRYTFPSGKTPLLRLDLKQGIGWDKMYDSRFTQLSPTVISGYRYSTGWAKNQRVYFYAEFSRPMTLARQEGDSVAYLRVNDGNNDEAIMACVGISATSVDEAKANLRHELTNWNIEAVKAQADKEWDKELGRIKIETTNTDDRTIFYTALYHTMIAPSEISDDDAPSKRYTTFSLWDTYRAQMPLFTLIHRDRCADIGSTFMSIFATQGKLPVWHLWNNETDCMVGNPGVPVLADLVLKGLYPNKEETFTALKTSQLRDERGLKELRQYGYIPFDKDTTNETVAKGLEYALADWSTAQVAKVLGKTDDYNYFLTRSKSYTHYFDKSVDFMRGVNSKAQFRTPFNPFHSVHRFDDFTEGNAWQYTWLVPHDVHGLVSLFGSEKKFTKKLDSLFVVHGDLGKDASPDISGLIGEYAHGNEPSHHIIYMYNYVGQPWKAAPLLRRVYREMYQNAPDGLSGNEDVGQMSAWYVISTCGLYQVEPAGGKFIIGSPLFEKAALNVGNGKTFTVLAKDNSDKNVYVQRVMLNGKPYTKSYISYDDIIKGGTLELVMGPKPSKWGTAKADRP
jgi:predicted alpha-1,2-mannosidase